MGSPFRAVMTVALTLLSAQVHADSTALEASTDVEIYNERGQISGCGLSFTVLWLDDSHQPIGVNGSMTLLADLSKQSVFSLLKVAAAQGSSRVKVAYAWVETRGYGRTTDLKQSPSEDGLSFIAGKAMDQKSVMLPYEMANSGFKLGITQANYKIDDVVLVPPTPDKAVGLLDCLGKLQGSMEKRVQITPQQKNVSDKILAALPYLKQMEEIVKSISVIFQQFESGTAEILKNRAEMEKLNRLNNELLMTLNSMKDGMRGTGIFFAQMELKPANPNLRPVENYNILTEDLGKILQAEAFIQDWKKEGQVK